MREIIGLKRGTVNLKKHNPDWIKLFEKEKKMLFKKFPNVILEVSHGGSTSIPNIPAKPIIDMFVAVKSLKGTDKIRKYLEKLNYEYRGKEGVMGRILYVKHIKGKTEIRTHHLQFIEKRNKEWKNHLLIKNYYLKHPKEAKKYAELKRKLAKKYANNRELYSRGKNNFIASIIKKAKLENKK